MFIKIGEDYLNLNQIARVEYKMEGPKTVATVYFAKPGGSDRHIIYNADAEKLRHALEAALPIPSAELNKLCKKAAAASKTI